MGKARFLLLDYDSCGDAVLTKLVCVPRLGKVLKGDKSQLLCENIEYLKKYIYEEGFSPKGIMLSGDAMHKELKQAFTLLFHEIEFGKDGTCQICYFNKSTILLRYFRRLFSEEKVCISLLNGSSRQTTAFCNDSARENKNGRWRRIFRKLPEFLEKQHMIEHQMSFLWNLCDPIRSDENGCDHFKLSTLMWSMSCCLGISGRQCEFYFFDDHDVKILAFLKLVFSVYPQLIPEGVVLHLIWYFAGDKCIDELAAEGKSPSLVEKSTPIEMSRLSGTGPVYDSRVCQQVFKLGNRHKELYDSASMEMLTKLKRARFEVSSDVPNSAQPYLAELGEIIGVTHDEDRPRCLAP